MLGLTALLAACNDVDVIPRAAILLSPEGNRLHAYDTEDIGSTQVLIPSHDDDPERGRDVNGQVCVEPGTRRFIAGEDTGQPSPPPGFGVFEIRGSAIGSLSAEQVGKLAPTFQGEPGPEGVPDTADPYGCGFLSDGRLVTSDIGNTASGPANGQVILWFPPLDAAAPRYCKLDVAVGTAGGVYVDDRDRVYVAAARVDSGILRYTGPFPTSDDAAGGCGRVDSTGAPLADAVVRERFIAADENIPTPNGVAGSDDGTLYVSSIVNGVIAEFDRDGRFLRRILEPPAGEALGPRPYTTGTPLGLTVDEAGNVYYADLGLVVSASGIGPGPRLGSVRTIRFEGGEPTAPITLGSGLTFPDGVGIFYP
jgi:sugar lactone lactonase YvrE